MPPKTDKTQVGGKNKKGNGKGKGKGKNNGGFGNGNGKGKGKGNGKGGKNGCEDVSPCMMKLSINGAGKKGNASNGSAAALVPPAHAAAVMEENLRVAHKNIEWLRTAASGIDIKILEKSRNSATMCVPSNAVRTINEVLLIHKGLMTRMNDIVKEVRELSVNLHVDMVTFRDGANRQLDPLTDSARITDLLIDGHLYFGGAPLRALLSIENEAFRDRIFLEGAVADATLSRFAYRPNENMFVVTYNTDMGAYQVVFSVGVDGRAVEPQVDRSGAGAGSYEIILLSEGRAEDLARRDALAGRRASTSTRASLSRRRPVSSRIR